MPKTYGLVADVSNHQGGNLAQIDELKAKGVMGLIAKVSEGSGYVDPFSTQYIFHADQIGMKTAGYHFARFGGNQATALAEANFFGGLLASRLAPGSLAVLDYEADASGSVADNTNAILVFMRRIKELGYQPKYYSYKPYTVANVDIRPILKEFPNSIWIAGYPGPHEPAWDYFPSMDGVFMWQFDDKFPTSFGGVDMSVLLMDWPEGGKNMATGTGVGVWEHKGIWYKDAKLTKIANGMVMHMGEWWYFENGRVTPNRWVHINGYVYWVGAKGVAMQGKNAPMFGMTFDLGEDNTYYLRGIKIDPKKANKDVLNSMFLAINKYVSPDWK